MNKEELLDLINKEGDQKEWNYKDFKCKIIRNSLKSLCGYIYLEKEDLFYNKDYNDIPVDVHGGLTYASTEGDYWVIGFDCSHSGDLSPYLLETDFSYGWLKQNMGIYRDMGYVKRECERLADQISELDLPRKRRKREEKINKVLSNK
jgi:hypothetical protein